MKNKKKSNVLNLKSFGSDFNAAVIGSSGGIGGAFVNRLKECRQTELFDHGLPFVFLDTEDLINMMMIIGFH